MKLRHSTLQLNALLPVLNELNRANPTEKIVAIRNQFARLTRLDPTRLDEIINNNNSAKSFHFRRRKIPIELTWNAYVQKQMHCSDFMHTFNEPILIPSNPSSHVSSALTPGSASFIAGSSFFFSKLDSRHATTQYSRSKLVLSFVVAIRDGFSSRSATVLCAYESCETCICLLQLIFVSPVPSERRRFRGARKCIPFSFRLSYAMHSR